MAIQKLPPLDILNQTFFYESETGKLFWRKNDNIYSSSMTRVLNKEAGSLCTNGYRKIKFQKKYYLAHRIIWKINTGNDPLYIDHINKNRSDNKISNLRSVTFLENNQNKKLSHNNKSGFYGVSFCNRMKKWKSGISLNKKNIHLGYFENKYDAIKSRKKPKEIYFTIKATEQFNLLLESAYNLGVI